MECRERILLLVAYERRIKHYRNAVLELKDKVRSVPDTELKVLWTACDYARDACEIAHRALRKHTEEHGC
jgi:hypothetical protein